MSDCCSQISDLGCFNFCGTILTGVTATQTGDYRIDIVGGSYILVNITSGNQIMFDNDFNEDSITLFTITAPDGTSVTASDGSDCFQVLSLPAIQVGVETVETGGSI